MSNRSQELSLNSNYKFISNLHYYLIFVSFDICFIVMIGGNVTLYIIIFAIRTYIKQIIL